MQFDIIEEEQRSEPVTPTQEELPKKPPQRGRSASKEEAEIIEIKQAEPAQTPIEEDVPKVERKSSVHATVEEAENVEAKNEPKTPVEEEVPKKKAQKAVAAQKAEADVVAFEGEKEAGKVEKKELDRQESQKGVRQLEDEEDEEVEALLRRAQRQRSLIGDLSKESQAEQGTLKHIYEHDVYTHCIGHELSSFAFKLRQHAFRRHQRTFKNTDCLQDNE